MRSAIRIAGRLMTGDWLSPYQTYTHSAVRDVL